ncbi:hypothetical protein [Dietzia sp. ANT_WB102]|uniref:hypothetical protein n=1 Tax=Dietzia sp. ANT_WB102 TaxID=2597345 RepID=UPI0011EF39F6|nr:hypothetical protein [Dietzia sp. ANT_WB102]KAA0918199.1 hypothetical protein FQ137_02155 [Dietzia sp. ANT_WB102]
MNVRTGDMATRDDDGQRESLGNREGPYEHPALDPETGYWAGRWLEFKRLFARSWNDGYTKETVILCAIVWAVMAFGMTFLGWR